MTEFSYAALVLDLDGTLIGRDERISPRVAASIGSVLDSLKVSIATGREPADVLRFSRELGLTTPQISDNGALILDPSDASEVWSAPMGPRQAENIVTRLSSLNLVFIATHPGGTITDITDIPHWNLTRVSALDMDEKSADALVAEYVSNPALHTVKAYLPYNDSWAVDFTRNGVDKSTAVRRLAGLLGIDTRQMIAAGDSYNDLPLLEACGLRIAMGNAPDELKAIADYIAPTVDEDGLAVAIEEFVLPRLSA